MVDREKVIHGLKMCIKARCGEADCFDCCYCDDKEGGCQTHLFQDALALLKEQEPRKPHYTTLGYVVNGKVMSVKHPECPRCWDNGLMLWDAEIEDGAAYCKRCGQAVKWK